MKSLISLRQKSDKSVEGLVGEEAAAVEEEDEEDYSNGKDGGTEAGENTESLLFNDDRTVARFGSAVTVTVDSSISFSLSEPFISEEEHDEEENEDGGEADATGSVHSRSSTSSSGRHSRHSRDSTGKLTSTNIHTYIHTYIHI